MFVRKQLLYDPDKNNKKRSKKSVHYLALYSPEFTSDAVVFTAIFLKTSKSSKEG